MEIFFLVVLGGWGGAAAAIALAVVLLAFADFFLRSIPVILGEVLGILTTTGAYFLILLIVGAVH